MATTLTELSAIAAPAVFWMANHRVPHVVAVVVVAVVMMLPKSYVSKATILVESQQIPSDLARSTVTSAAEERIALIRQRLIARKNLLQIVDDFSLYPKQQEKLSPTEIVTSLRLALRGTGNE